MRRFLALILCVLLASPVAAQDYRFATPSPTEPLRLRVWGGNPATWSSIWQVQGGGSQLRFFTPSIFDEAVTIKGALTLGNTPIVATGTEINFLSGLSSNLQGQLNSISAGASQVTDVFGRSGAITPQQTDYDAFFTTPDEVAALAPAAPVTSVAGQIGVVTLTKSDVGLSNVDNTSDTGKPVSTAMQSALDAKASLASPALTGTPTAPTATAGTNTTQVATTAYVLANGGTPANMATTDTVQTITGTKTFSDIAVTGTCTGCGTGISGTVVAAAPTPSLMRFTPPPTDGWSWFRQDGATQTSTADSQFLSYPATTTGIGHAGLTRTAPAPPYTIVAAIVPNHKRALTGYQTAGIGFRESSSGKTDFLMVTENPRDATDKFWVHNAWSTTNTSYTAYSARFPRGQTTPVMWVALRDDGTNLTMYTSYDGVTFNQYVTKARTSIMVAGPNEIVFHVANDSMTVGSDVAAARLVSWEVMTSAPARNESPSYNPPALPMHSRFSAPPTDGWSWFNQDGATNTITSNSLSLTYPATATAAHTLVGLVRTAPAPPYTAIIGVLPTHVRVSTVGTQMIGFGLRQSSSGKLDTITINLNPHDTASLKSYYQNSWADSPIGTHYGSAVSPTSYVPTVVWLAVRDDGTNVTFYKSEDGIAFQPLYTKSRTAFLLATGGDQLSLLVGDISMATGTTSAGVRVVSWEVMTGPPARTEAGSFTTTNVGNVEVNADADADGLGKVELKTRGIIRQTINNDGTTLFGSAVTVPNLTITGTCAGCGNSGPTAGGVRARSTGAQSLANATDTAITFDVEDRDDDTYHSTTTNTSRFLAPATGWYVAQGQISFNSGAGLRQCSFRKNGTTVEGYAILTAVSGSSHQVPCTVVAYLVAGDYLELMGYHTAGGALTTNASSLNQLSMKLIGGSAAVTSVGGHYTATTDQTVGANTANVKIAWDTEVVEEGGLAHDNVTNNTRVTVPVAGWYSVVGTLHWNYNAGGTRQCAIYKNGVWVAAQALGMLPTANSMPFQCSALLKLAVNDYLELEAWSTVSTSIRGTVSGGLGALQIKLVP